MTIKDLLIPMNGPIHREQDWNIASYGVSGSGKTFWIRTVGEIPGWSPALIVDLDGSSTTIEEYGAKNVHLLRMDDVFKQRKLLDNNLRWKSFRHILDVLEAAFAGSRKPYNMVVIDGFSLVVDWVDKLLDKDGSSNDDPEPLSWQEYRFVRALIVDAIIRLRDLPVPVWVIAGEKKTVLRAATRGTAEKSYFEPAFPPAVGAMFSSLFDIVGRHSREMVQGKLAFQIRTKLSDEYQAKSRAAKMPSPITIVEGSPLAAMTTFARALHVPMSKDEDSKSSLALEEGDNTVGLTP